MNDVVMDWTEEELDAALLAVLDSSVALDPQTAPSSLETVPATTQAGTRRGRPTRRRWAVLVVAAAVLAFAAMLIPTLLPLGGRVQNTAAAATLDEAARNALRSVDPSVGTGQYLQITSDTVYAVGGGTETGDFITLDKSRTTTWIPQHPADD